MKNNTLVIDGNHMLFKCLYVLPKTGKILLDNVNDKSLLVQKMAMDFAAETRKFSDVLNRIVFVIDSSSWRKALYPQSDYKGNRETDESINWNNVWGAFKDFYTVLKDHGVIIQRIDGAEGDDLIFAWSSFLNSKGENVIVNSGDRDLTQLVQFNKFTNAYTIFYTNTQKLLIGYPGFFNWMNEEIEVDEVDIFNLGSNDFNPREVFKRLIDANELTSEETFPEEVILGKILGGDKGDNILPVYSYQKKNKNGKIMTFGVSDKKIEEIKILFEQDHGKLDIMYFFESSYKKVLVDLTCQVMKITSAYRDSVEKNLDRNINLVILHQKCIPEEILNQIYEEIETVYNNKIGNFSTLSNRFKILENTSYSNQWKPKENNALSKVKDDSMDFIIKDTNNKKGLF
jgi:5'-3' exonuclease